MGARVNFAFKTENKNYVVLYSHWGGEDRFNLLSNALEASRPRWNDNSYAIRIAISSIVGNNWNSETGFGIYVNEIGDYNYETFVVDFENKTIGIHESGLYINHTVKHIEQQPVIAMTFDEFLNSNNDFEGLIEGIREIWEQTSPK